MSLTPFKATHQRIKPSLHPREGFKFKDELGVVHVAASLVKLVESLTAYRARLGKPPGSPLEEITAYLCKRQPQLCTNNEPTVSMKAIIAHVVHDIATQSRKGPIEKVDPAELQRRADICLSCPCSVDWSKICGPCHTQHAAPIAEILSPDKPHPKLTRKCCTQGRDDLSLAAARKEPREVAEAPENCWRKET